VTSQIPTIPLAAAIHTGLSAEAMEGNFLTISALGSLNGATYTVVWTEPSATSFGGSADITFSPIPVPVFDGNGNWYQYFKVKVDWLGNEFTNPGSATSDRWQSLD
jgi:hypothetical protein